MRAIYKRELKSYFHSMIGYVLISFLVAFTGIYFIAYNVNYGYPYFSYVLSGILFVDLIAIPILTMRCFAEERKNKTDQLLLTAPVSLFQIVMGKYFAMVTILAVPCVVYLLFPLMIKAQGTAYILVDDLSILVFFLLGCVFIAIGMFISSLTESQIIAAIGTFGALLVLYIWNGLLSFVSSAAWVNAIAVALILSCVVFVVWQMTRNIIISAVLETVVIISCVVTYLVKSSLFEGLLSEILGKLDLAGILTNISDNHLLDVSGILLYLSIIAVFVFLTMQMIQKRRWS
ncbi:MAG: ABC transporter permease subunit [Dorea sp.]|nr:ABC transporter permease subunit [Dorea sp.]